jgi:uncharacterized protein with PIN domain
VICTDCDKAELKFRETESIETHGLECGPYEHFHDEWWECPACGAWFTARELGAMS